MQVYMQAFLATASSSAFQPAMKSGAVATLVQPVPNGIAPAHQIWQ